MRNTTVHCILLSFSTDRWRNDRQVGVGFSERHLCAGGPLVCLLITSQMISEHMRELTSSKLRLLLPPLICASSSSLQGSTSNSGPNSNLLALADRTMPMPRRRLSLNLLCMGAMPVDGDWESEHSKPAQHRRLPKCPPMWWPPEWSPDLTGMGRVRRWKPPEEQGKKVLVEWKKRLPLDRNSQPSN